MKYGEVTLGQIEAIINKLGGMEGVRRFLSDELRLAIPQFTVWMTVKVGVHKNLKALHKALHKALKKFNLGDWAKDILNKPAFTLAQTEEDIPLCVTTVKMMTGKDRATTTEIFNAIKFIGDLCPAEVGPVLREQYQDQPNDEWLFIAMEPIKDAGGDLGVFNVGRDGGGVWLDASGARPDSVWGGSIRFVFRARKYK